MYSLAKIDPTDPTGQRYEYAYHYVTWRELMINIENRRVSNNEMLMGRGCDILEDEIYIGHTSDLDRIDKPYILISLADLPD